uniref:Protein kinase domain-containing protein n=1 Tax=Sinocyclocheilus grahami TaxID=75366 RepID=A0A672K3Y3_SINGR
MDEGDGPAELMEDCPQVPASIAERYKVGRMIGDGNFAVVRECVERSTGREYALKIINKSKCRGKVRRFLKKSYSVTTMHFFDITQNNDARSSVLHLWLTGTHDPE